MRLFVPVNRKRAGVLPPAARSTGAGVWIWEKPDVQVDSGAAVLSVFGKLFFPDSVRGALSESHHILEKQVNEAVRQRIVVHYNFHGLTD